MRRGVVNSGTAGRLRYSSRPYKFTADICGKTGTTNSNADAWFMGVVPKLVVGCWVGGDDRDIHFNNMSYGQGAAAALPIYGNFMLKVFNDKSLGMTRLTSQRASTSVTMSLKDLRKHLRRTTLKKEWIQALDSHYMSNL